MFKTKSVSSQQMKKQKHIKDTIHTISGDWHKFIQMLASGEKEKDLKSANIIMIKSLK